MINIVDLEVPQRCEHELEKEINDLVESYGENLCFVFTYSLIENKELYADTTKVFNHLVKDLQPSLDVEFISAQPEYSDTIMVTVIGAADEDQRMVNNNNIQIKILNFYKNFTSKTKGTVLTAILDIFEGDNLDPIEQYAFGDSEILETAGLTTTEFNH